MTLSSRKDSTKRSGSVRYEKVPYGPSCPHKRRSKSPVISFNMQAILCIPSVLGYCERCTSQVILPGLPYSRYTKYCTVGMLCIGMLISISLKLYEDFGPNPPPANQPQHHKYVLSFCILSSFVIYHLSLGLITIATKNSRGWEAPLHRDLWVAKAVLLIILTLVSRFEVSPQMASMKCFHEMYVTLERNVNFGAAGIMIIIAFLLIHKDPFGSHHKQGFVLRFTSGLVQMAIAFFIMTYAIHSATEQPRIPIEPQNISTTLHPPVALTSTLFPNFNIRFNEPAPPGPNATVIPLIPAYPNISSMFLKKSKSRSGSSKDSMLSLSANNTYCVPPFLHNKRPLLNVQMGLFVALLIISLLFGLIANRDSCRILIDFSSSSTLLLFIAILTLIISQLNDCYRTTRDTILMPTCIPLILIPTFLSIMFRQNSPECPYFQSRYPLGRFYRMVYYRYKPPPSPRRSTPPPNPPDDDDEVDHVQYSWALFHLICALSSAFVMCMLYKPDCNSKSMCPGQSKESQPCTGPHEGVTMYFFVSIGLIISIIHLWAFIERRIAYKKLNEPRTQTPTVQL